MVGSAIVNDTGIVAALGTGNDIDIVVVIDAVNEQPQKAELSISAGMLHLQKLDVYQRSIDSRSPVR